MKRQASIITPRKKILFLGYDKKQTLLIDYLLKNNCDVDQTDKKIFKFKAYDFVISYGYRYI